MKVCDVKCEKCKQWNKAELDPGYLVHDCNKKIDDFLLPPLPFYKKNINVYLTNQRCKVSYLIRTKGVKFLM